MTVRDIVAIALFAALIAAFGFLPPVPVPVIAVPVTAQTLGVMLAGALLGAKRGFCAVVIIWLLVAAGLPLLPGGRGGISIFLSPTAGYFVGWAFAAWLIGFFYDTFRNSITPAKELVFLTLGGIAAIYCPGILWLSCTTHMPVNQAFSANLFFLPGDIIKIVIACFIIRIIRKALPDALR